MKSELASLTKDQLRDVEIIGRSKVVQGKFHGYTEIEGVTHIMVELECGLLNYFSLSIYDVIFRTPGKRKE